MLENVADLQQMSVVKTFSGMGVMNGSRERLAETETHLNNTLTGYNSRTKVAEVGSAGKNPPMLARLRLDSVEPI